MRRGDTAGERGTIYLLHFTPPYRHAKHYLGWAAGGPAEVEARLARHLRGDGSPLVKAAVGAGCAVTVVRTWPDRTRDDERVKHSNRHHPKLCPVCRALRVRRR